MAVWFAHRYLGIFLGRHEYWQLFGILVPAPTSVYSFFAEDGRICVWLNHWPRD